MIWHGKVILIGVVMAIPGGPICLFGYAGITGLGWCIWEPSVAHGSLANILFGMGDSDFSFLDICISSTNNLLLN
jgi:hypothetical protein